MSWKKRFTRVGPSRGSAADPPARPPLEEAEALVEAGRLVEAVDLLAAANRAHRDPAVEIRLIGLRHDAARSYAAGEGRTPWPPTYPDPFPEVEGRLPEIDAADLTTDVLGGGVAHHGCLIVRGVLNGDQVARSVAAIHRAQDRRSRHDGSEPAGSRTDGSAGSDRSDVGDPTTDEWYRPFATGKTMQQALRQIVGDQGGTWLADSPASTAQVLDDLREAGVIDAITGHLGERPLFSLQKSTLRRSIPKNKLVAWHQDGSFLDPDVRTINAWVALSRCGGEYPAPGMEVLPRRLAEILPIDGELTPHSISATLVEEIARETPIIRPEFAPGDAMLFDERFLHRTYLNPDMTEDRYALECWFFAPSHASSNYLPFLV